MKMQSSSRQIASRTKDYSVIGWREWIALPELGVKQLAAKIDTGARTSALHATDINVRSDGGEYVVDFTIPTHGHGGHRCTAKLVDQRAIKNTGGKAENRLVVRTILSIDGRRWPIDLSLTNREAMTFDLILGRTAVRRHKLVVDPGRSYLTKPPSTTNRLETPEWQTPRKD